MNLTIKEILNQSTKLTRNEFGFWLEEHEFKPQPISFKRAYIGKTLGWKNGVLIQEKVKECAHHNSNTHGKCCKEAKQLAKKLKISD